MGHTHPSARGELCSSNHIGSSSYLTDDNGEVHEFFAYFPSGETWIDQSGAFGTDYKFTGKELDKETGLYYFGARYYDPRTQVWQSPDPILGSYLDGERGMGGVYNSPNLNLYGYTGNNPINLVDLDGRDASLYSKDPAMADPSDLTYPVTEGYDINKILSGEQAPPDGGEFARNTILGMAAGTVMGKIGVGKISPKIP